MGRQVVAFGRKLNLRRDLRLGDQTHSQVSSQAKYTRVAKKKKKTTTFQGRLILCFNG